MQLINGNTVSKIKTKALINKTLGKKTSFLDAFSKKGIGTAGLEYVSGITEIDRIREDLRLLANIETRPNGLLIYLNNPEERYYIILPFGELKSIDYTKKADILKPKEGGLFSKVLKQFDNYIWAKKFLLEPEIVKQNEAILSITGTQQFTLKNTKNNYRKVSSYLESLKGKLNVLIDVKDYTIDT